MSNIVKKTGSLPAAVSNIAKMAANVSAHSNAIQTGDAYGGFAKHGEWFFGQERIEPQEGSQWAINPLSLRHGHIHWPEDGRPTEVMVPLTDPLPAKDSLPAVENDKWDTNFSFQARCLNGEDEGQQVIFKGSSLGFQKAFVAVAQQIASRAVEGLADVSPVVELGAGSYTHAKYGKIYTPEIKVVKWAGLDGEADEPEATPEPEPEAKPEEAAPEAPARRRRRARA